MMVAPPKLSYKAKLALWEENVRNRVTIRRYSRAVRRAIAKAERGTDIEKYIVR